MSEETTIIWMDGVFDLTHYGHYNAIRQGLQFGNRVLVGLHSDDEVEKNKGPPVLTQDERAALVGACRWADEVVCDAPYTTDLEFIKPYNVDYVVHGDDISTDADGLDAYRHVKSSGLYRECSRTRGVSTTDLISRLLSPHLRTTPLPDEDSPAERELLLLFAADKRWKGKQWSHDGVTCVKGVERMEDKGGTVYVVGAWEVLGVEDVEYLKDLSQRFDNVVVGVEAGSEIYERTGSYPLLTLKERTLALLALR
ncbi:Nucleotidylyl transferase [Atractiella rhizophila]|nr:Nucleotidylyl transferase [Atractiella rhizophila]